MIGKKNKTLIMIVTTMVKIKTTLSETRRIYHEGEGKKKEKRRKEKEKLLVLEELILQNKSLF